MAIPEAQLETWSHQGPTAQFTSTYDGIRTVLYDANSPSAARSFQVFLQGNFAAGQQADSESLFQVTDGVTECRLRNAKLRRGS
jgi:hypothetical protein